MPDTHNILPEGIIESDEQLAMNVNLVASYLGSGEFRDRALAAAEAGEAGESSFNVQTGIITDLEQAKKNMSQVIKFINSREFDKRLAAKFAGKAEALRSSPELFTGGYKITSGNMTSNDQVIKNVMQIIKCII
jgi:hypothetical protein